AVSKARKIGSSSTSEENELINKLTNTVLTDRTPPVIRPAILTLGSQSSTIKDPQEQQVQNVQQNKKLLQTIRELALNTAILGLHGKTDSELNSAQRAAMAQILSGLKETTDEINNAENHLLNSATMNLSRSVNKLDNPIYTTPPPMYRRHHGIMQTVIIRDNVRLFDPTDINSDIVRTWKQLRKYGSKNFFDEADYIEAWGKVVEGEAHKQFLHYEDTEGMTLRALLDMWQESYCKQKDSSIYEKRIDNYIRPKNQLLIPTMMQVSLMIEQLSFTEEPDKWPTARDMFKRRALMRLILPKTVKFLKFRISRTEHANLKLSVDDLITLADIHEQENDGVPNVDWGGQEHQMFTNSMNLVQEQETQVPINAFNPSSSWGNQKPQRMDTDQQQQRPAHWAPKPTQPPSPAYPTQVPPPSTGQQTYTGQQKYVRYNSNERERTQSGSRYKTPFIIRRDRSSSTGSNFRGRSP
ncbi:MAG: hypothetical protein ACOYB0_11030, partial [Polynucleobacter sp.]